eukprot:gene9141-9309_t
MLSEPTSKWLDNVTGQELLQEVDTIIFDCDGVLWRGNEVIPCAVEALQVMRDAGKRLFFVTNNSSKSRAQYLSKFNSLGIDADCSEIVSSSYTAAAYLASIGFGTQVQPGKSVLLLGNHADNIGNNRMMPGTGTLVSALAMAASMQPVNVGKGGSWLFPFLLQQFQIEPSRTAVVGDRLDTDIALAKEGGLISILPLTGVTSLEQVQRPLPESIVPDFIISSVAVLAGLG